MIWIECKLKQWGLIVLNDLQGDSGGPLICKGHQIGLVAAGLGCGLGYPSYFTKIAPFHDFFQKYIPELRKKRSSLVIQPMNSVSTFVPAHIGYLTCFTILFKLLCLITLILI